MNGDEAGLWLCLGERLSLNEIAENTYFAITFKSGFLLNDFEGS
jgi:hypothetical protein